jgi:hypothetical protein
LSLTKDEDLKRKLTKDYYALKAERDLKCLNNKKQGCDMVDAEEHSYIEKDGVFYTYRPFTLYRLKKKGDFTPEHSINTIK